MTPDLTPRRAAYYTLGCKLNFAETSTIGKILADKGFRRAESGEVPDICVINTCSVTEMADKKGRTLIRRLARKWPEATMVVTGCYAQLKPQQVAGIPGVDIVLGSNEKLRIAEFIDRWEAHHTPITDTTSSLAIKEFQPSCEKGDRTRWWLKVQDGCDYFCTYCTIPFARGRSRSGRIDSLAQQARQAAAQGAKEIVITGVNIGCFGQDTGETLIDLLKALDSVEGIERFRISSIEPNLLTEEIIRWTATEARAFMPHFHIPLQSGSDAVLKVMNRRYDTELFASRLNLIKSLIPDAFIGVDVIAGARGETPAEWQRTQDYLATVPFTRLHVFPYSERPGTKALTLQAESVDVHERHLRAARLQEISDERMLAFMRQSLGQTRPVLWEHPVRRQSNGAAAEEPLMTGLTDNYLRVVAPLRKELLNNVTPAKLISISRDMPETILAEHA